MVKLRHFTLFILLLCACDSETPGDISREYFKNSKIEFVSNQHYENEPVVETGYIQSGDNITFRYTFNHPQQDEIADDELSEVFIFEIPKNADSFSYSTSESITNNVLIADYRRACFCYFTGFDLQSATISANRISATAWQVSFDIVIKDDYSEYPLKDSGIYRLGSL
jgi:hypothetical protein